MLREKLIRGTVSLIFKIAGLKDKDRKNLLRNIVKDNWGDLPVWSTLEHPTIEEVAKASIGCGVVLVFRDPNDGVMKTVVAEAGKHYGETDEPRITIPGGFITIDKKLGSSYVEADDTKGEDGREGAARETEEEMPSEHGNAMLKVDPDRLVPMDTKTINFPNGEHRVVIGFMLELTDEEAQKFVIHAKRTHEDEQYKEAVQQHTINPASGLPEVDRISILPLDKVAKHHYSLLHGDQISLFQITNNYFKALRRNRHTPTGTSPA